MKFQKFVKSIGSEGVVFQRLNGERWLSCGTVCMKIPNNIHSITTREVTPMPVEIDDIIDLAASAVACELKRAIMPYADGGIKDCLRVYKGEYTPYELAISHSAYSLIEKKDAVLMCVLVSPDEQDREPVALAIKKWWSGADADDDDALLGIILPAEC